MVYIMDKRFKTPLIYFSISLILIVILYNLILNSRSESFFGVIKLIYAFSIIIFVFSGRVLYGRISQKIKYLFWSITLSLISLLSFYVIIENSVPLLFLAFPISVFLISIISLREFFKLS